MALRKRNLNYNVTKQDNYHALLNCPMMSQVILSSLYNVLILPPRTPTVRQRCVMFVDSEPSAKPRKQNTPPAVNTFLHVKRSHRAPTTGAGIKTCFLQPIQINDAPWKGGRVQKKVDK